MTSIDAILTDAISRIEVTAVAELTAAVQRVERQMLAQAYAPRGRWLSKAEARQYLGNMAASTFEHKVARGDIRSYQPNGFGYPLYSIQDLDAYALGAAEDADTEPTPIRSERAA
jgi:hypothetical protein